MFPSDFLGSIAMIYKSTPKSNGGLRNAALKHVRFSNGQLQADDTVITQFLMNICTMKTGTSMYLSAE